MFYCTVDYSIDFIIFQCKLTTHSPTAMLNNCFVVWKLCQQICRIKSVSKINCTLMKWPPSHSSANQLLRLSSENSNGNIWKYKKYEWIMCFACAHKSNFQHVDSLGDIYDYWSRNATMSVRSLKNNELWNYIKTKDLKKYIYFADVAIDLFPLIQKLSNWS